jgi:hypothetical protein
MIDRRSYRLRFYRWLEQPPWMMSTADIRDANVVVDH